MPLRHAPVLALCLAASCTRVIDAVGRRDCDANSTVADCAPTEWPTGVHSFNSDPWLTVHRNVITVMRPRVLVLNFFNAPPADPAATAQKEADAIAEGSRYHGYSDPSAPAFVQYEVVKVVDLTDHPPPAGWTNPSSTLLPTAPTGEFDVLALFSSQFADRYGFADPAADAQRSLSLCELFERGIINEVWIEDGEAGIRHAPFNLERRQMYDAASTALPGQFAASTGGGGTLEDIICGVTVRLAHLDPARGPGCDLQVRGWGIDGMWDALPAFAPEARAFLNDDFVGRFGVRFQGWPDICDLAGTPCVTYPTPTSARGSYADGTVWTIDPFLQGCGSSRFPSNAPKRGEFGSATTVYGRCEHFGLGDGPAGGDLYTPYSAATVSSEEAAVPDCGGGWQVYWRQSLPGYRTHARRPDGQPTGNWWPLLFY